MVENDREIVIREIEGGDREALASFFCANNVPEITDHFTPFALDAKTAKRIACEEREDRYYLGAIEGEVVAMTMLRGADEGFEIPSFGIMVDRRFHGKGLGRKMTEFTLSAARELGYDRVRLTVFAENKAAHTLYLSLGFKQVDKEQVEVTGQADTKIIMMKEI